MAKGNQQAIGRGRIVSCSLKKPFIFNGNRIDTAIIEIDHINFGLNKKTKLLNTKPRSKFTVRDIEKFLSQLNGEHIAARGYKGKVSQFEVRMDCPIAGRFYGRQFIMIFDTDYSRPQEIYTVTLYPGW